MEKRTSKEWYKELPKGFVIMDPDGWDRQNYEFSFNEEEITRKEFDLRCLHSTCLEFPIEMLDKKK